MKGRRYRTFLIIFLILIVVILFSLLSSKPVVCFKGFCLDVEIADDIESRKEGLMFREELRETKGMLFSFEVQGNYSFWMKNVGFPIDIIFISEEKKIIHIEHSALPCLGGSCIQYYSERPASYVLETAAGISYKYNLSVGDTVLLP